MERYIAAIVIGIVGAVAVALTQRRWLTAAILLATCWSTLFVPVHSNLANRVVVSASASGYRTGAVYIALTLVAFGSLLYMYFPLKKLWPGVATALGFPLHRNVIWQVPAGLLIGAVLARILHPASWTYLAQRCLDSTIILILGILAPLAFLEEAVFRGRLLAVLQRCCKRDGLAILLQGCIFMAVHIPGRLAMLGTGVNRLVVARGLLSILAVGCALGYARHRTGSLWAPTAAHIAYNLLVVLAVT